MRDAVIVALFAFAVSAQAGVYRDVGPDGETVYTDRPSEGAEEIKIPEAQTYSAPRLPAASEPAGAEADDKGFTGYETFEVVRPADDAPLRDNAGKVSISLSIEPSLRPDHRIDIYMDGKHLGGNGKTTSLTLTNVDRGTHNVSAVVKDRNGTEIARTKPVTFHLLRVSR